MQEDERGEILIESFHGLDKKFLSNLRDYIRSDKLIFFGPEAKEAWAGYSYKGHIGYNELDGERTRIP